METSFKEQLSGMAIDAKCIATYPCISMDDAETELFKTQERAPLILCRYIDDIFFIWTHGKDHLETFLQKPNSFIPDFKYTYESNEKEIPFLDFKVKLKEGKINRSLYQIYGQASVSVFHIITS